MAPRRSVAFLCHPRTRANIDCIVTCLRTRGNDEDDEDDDDDADEDGAEDDEEDAGSRSNDDDDEECEDDDDEDDDDVYSAIAFLMDFLSFLFEAGILCTTSPSTHCNIDPPFTL